MNDNGKIRPNFGHCQIVSNYYQTSAYRYKLEGCNHIDIYWNPNSFLRLNGSIMYYWQGHNFTYQPESFVRAIKHIGKLLQVDLWNSIVDAFEYGAIMQVDEAPKNYIKNHKAKSSEKLNQSIDEKHKGCLSRWTDSNVSLKMYDVGRNIKMKQGSNRRQIIQDAGWNPNLNYLKWEAHYSKPMVLNNGNPVLLHNLVHPDWQNVFKEDLYLQYKRLIPMSNIIEPTNKADLSTADILALELVERCINTGMTLQEVNKLLYGRINAFSSGVLSKSDKDSRKKQIKAILGKMQEAGTSKWDLSQKLTDALEGNNAPCANNVTDSDPLI